MYDPSMTSTSESKFLLVREIPHGLAILVLICLGGFFISLLINYPGFMSPDSSDQLIEARNGVYSDWHPPFIAFLWHFTDRIIEGSFGMLLLLTALIWLGTFLVTLYWFNKERFTLLSLFPALIVFYPPLFGISGTIWKDNFMWAFLMMAIGAAGSLEPVSSTRRWVSYVKLAIIASLLLMAMLARHNAVFAAVPIMILSIARFLGKHPPLYRIAVPSAVGLLVSVLLQFCGGLTTEYLATYKTNVWGQLAIFDVAGIIYRMPDHQQQQTFYARVPPRLRGAGSVDRLLETYDPSNSLTIQWGPEELLALRADGNAVVPGKQPAFGCAMDNDPSAPPNNVFDTYCFELTEQEKGSLIQLWSTSVIHFPLEWLSHRMSVFRHVIGTPYGSVYMDQKPEYWLAKILGHPAPDLKRFQTRVKWFLDRLTVHLMLLYKPWVYLALTITIIGACLLSLAEERLQIALIAASGLAHEAGLFLLAPASDYRYSHYMIYTSIVALLLLLRTYLIGPLREGTAQPATRVG